MLLEQCRQMTLALVVCDSKGGRVESDSGHRLMRGCSSILLASPMLSERMRKVGETDKLVSVVGKCTRGKRKRIQGE